jgi:hypothetical protein
MSLFCPRQGMIAETMMAEKDIKDIILRVEWKEK